jgi:hypothetical protein
MVAPAARAIAGGVPEIERDRVGHCDASSRVANIRSFEKFTLVGARVGVLKVYGRGGGGSAAAAESQAFKGIGHSYRVPASSQREREDAIGRRSANRKQGKKSRVSLCLASKCKRSFAAVEESADEIGKERSVSELAEPRGCARRESHGNL